MPRPRRSAPTSAQPAAALHDRPTAVELLHASREALGDDVLPQLDGRAAFQLRVVLRALGIVGRELEHSAEHAEMRAAALASVGCADERELAREIREGGLDASDLARAGRRARHRARQARGRQPELSEPDRTPATEDR